QLYNYRTLKWLIKEALKVEFFVEVCCEGILGIPSSQGFPFDDLFQSLNRLISVTTGFGEFLKHDDLTQRFFTKPVCVEQKTLAFLLIWAVFVNNLKIVSKLWPHHSMPINACLMVSAMLKNMAKYVIDISSQQQMLKISVEYGQIATKLLEEVYQVNPKRAVEFATFRSRHWSYQTAIDMAAATELYEFISHPSCQRYLTNLYFNGMHLKQSPYDIFDVPSGVKIILSAFLIFPIYLWFEFPDYIKEHEEELLQEKQRIKEMSKNDLLTRIKIYGTSAMKTVSSDINIGKKYEETLKALNEMAITDLSLIQKVGVLWSAPMTKYWLYHIFYVLFLLVFSYDVLLPGCSYRRLDLLIFVWITAMLMEDVRKTYVTLKKFVSFRLTTQYIEISATMIFLCIFYLGRIIRFVPIARHTYAIRMIMSGALYLYYFRYLAMFLPISSIFGPLYYQFREIAFNDIWKFLFICSPFMIGGAIVIYVSHFPDRYIVFIDIFHRVFFSLFRTYDDYMFENPTCVADRDQPFKNQTYCRESYYSNPTCNLYGFWPYLMNLMFLILLKNVLLTLLEALANTTISLLDTPTIWKFQRFHSIVEFRILSPLPPPFNIVYYAFKLLTYLCCNFCRKKKSDRYTEEFTESDYEIKETCYRCEDSDLVYFANRISEKVVLKEKQRSEMDSTVYRLSNLAFERSQQVEYTKLQVMRLRRTVVSLYSMLQNLQIVIEAAKHKLKKEESVQQVLSRTSPYPNSIVERTAVSDKYVPWDVAWVDYDPLVFTRPKTMFPKEMNADGDINEEIFEKTPSLVRRFNFNGVYTDSSQKKIDRRTWITDNKKRPINYTLDGIYPLNPYGRTGLAGKGSLPRWGPNHFITILVTKYSGNEFEMLVRQGGELNSSDYTLIGGFIAHQEETYDTVRSQMDPTSNIQWKQSDEMISFFEQQVDTEKVFVERKITEGDIHIPITPFATMQTNAPIFDFDAETDETFKPTFQKPGELIEKKGIQYQEVLKGYFDSPVNTDNAWKETEFWRIHYTTDNLKKHISNCVWLLLKDDARSKFSPEEWTLIQYCLTISK
ncbi:protein ced-11-like protein, partial [Leptotrombidium deliense]